MQHCWPNNVVRCWLRFNQGFQQALRTLLCKGRFPLRKKRIGSDRTGLFSILYYPHRQTKKVESTLTLYHMIIGSNWNRKLVPKAHARVQFCSDPVRSHGYFPEWKPALIRMYNRDECMRTGWFGFPGKKI